MDLEDSAKKRVPNTLKQIEIEDIEMPIIDLDQKAYISKVHLRGWEFGCRRPLLVNKAKPSVCMEAANSYPFKSNPPKKKQRLPVSTGDFSQIDLG